jgi:hypothetical protein
MATLHASVRAGVVFLLTTSCTFYGSTEARQLPPRTNYEAGEGPPKEIRIDASSPERAEAIEGALVATIAILNSEAFQAVLKAEPLRRGPQEEPAAIGEEVAEFLSKGLPASVTFLERPQGFCGFFGMGSTTGTTKQAIGVVSLAPFRIEEWINGRSGLLVNTLAHELTHLDPRYIDGDDREYCDEATLVSYRVGDLAQCLYESKGNSVDLEQCATTMTNGVPDRVARLTDCHDAAH